MPARSALALLWGTLDRPKRGPKPSLTLARIVAEAVVMADVEGLANLSMARLAERLGCAKMALYRYVPGKNELTALMLDYGLGVPPDPSVLAPESGEAPWRAYLRLWTISFYDLVRDHPWAHELVNGVRPVGPNELAWMEAALTSLAGTGLTGAEKLDTIVLLLGHGRIVAFQNASMVGEDWEGQFLEELVGVLAAQAERFPQAVSSLAESMSGTAAESGRGMALEYGIDRILDGVAALIATRGQAVLQGT
ncbi:TetR/AcrR family transcriptional regulator [Nocardia heshunensis]